MPGFVLGPDEGRSLAMGPFTMTVNADTAATGGALTVLEADEPAGFGPPRHIHDDAGEAFYVLDGEYVIFLERAEHRCPAGSFIYIPAGVEHGFRVGAMPSRKLNIYVPAAMEGYFEALASAAASGESPTDQQLTELTAAHSMRVVGTVPEGYV
jgi:mannose-6-phosphate isomerase-like protein (cupin superfamily)